MAIGGRGRNYKAKDVESKPLGSAFSMMGGEWRMASNPRYSQSLICTTIQSALAIKKGGQCAKLTKPLRPIA